MASARTFHVVTYVDRLGASDGARMEPLASQTLALPAEGADGGALDGVLDTVASYQCDGQGEATDACTRVHGHANERILSRLGSDGGARVTWRRFHPRIAAGVARPGVPFEARSATDGTIVRVEVREIDTSDRKDTLTPERISRRALRRLAAEIDAHVGDWATPTAVYAQFKNLEHAMDGPIARLSELSEALQDLPDQPAIQGEIVLAREQFTTILSEARDAARVLIRSVPGPDQAALQNYQQETERGAQAMRLTLANIERIRAQFEGLERIHTDLTSKIARIEEIVASIALGREILGMEVPVDGRDLLRAMREFVEETTNDPRLERLRTIGRPLADFDRRLRAIDEAGQTVRSMVTRRRAEFSARVAAIQGWKNEEKEEQVLRFVAQGQGYPGFSVYYWSEEAKKAVAKAAAAMPPIGELSFEVKADHDALDQLEGLEGKALAEFYDRIKPELARRAKGVFREMEVDGLRFQLPFGSVRVLDRQLDALRVEVEIRNQDEKPMVVGCGAEGGVAQYVTLERRGEVARFQMWTDSIAPLVFRIQSVAETPLSDHGFEPTQFRHLDVQSAPVAIRKIGAHQIAAPSGYVLKGLVAGAPETRNVLLEPRPEGFEFSRQEIPGESR